MQRKIIFLSLLLIACIGSLFAGTPVQFSPEHPTPGETVQITYKLAETPLQDAKSFDAIAYLMSDESPFAVEINMKKEGDAYVGTIATTAETKALFVKFENVEMDIVDNNDDKGYRIKMYQEDRETPVAGARFAIGKAYYMDARSIGVGRDIDMGMTYMKKEMEAYPASKTNIAYLKTYLAVLARSKDEAALADLRTVADDMSKDKKSAEKLTMAHDIYAALKEEETASTLEKLIKKKYPKGDMAKAAVRDEFYKSRSDLAQMEAKYAEMGKMIDISNEDDKSMMQNLAMGLAYYYAQKGETEKVNTYVDLSEEADSRDNYLNAIASMMAGKGLEGEGKDLETAEKFSQKSIAYTQNRMENPAEHKPDYMTSKQFVNGQKMTFSYEHDTYALICHKLGKAEDALKYQTKALALATEADADWYERHAVYFEKEKGAEATEALLATYIKENNATASMNTRYKELFLANNTLESAFEKHLAALEASAMEVFRKELEAKMIDMPAPDFDLVNLDGEAIKLSDMKGKVVILDFWATWCGPCKASFPAMQKTQDLFAGNDKVQFLFINSWERSENVEEVVSTFITEKEYTFNVPLDKDNQVIGAYKVEGIPTKFVIGPNGHIRFKSVGFSGSDEGLIKEMKMMIEMAGGDEDVSMSMQGK